MLHLTPLEFGAPEPDQCCDLCNRPHFADYETACVVVRAPGGIRLHVCLACVRCMARAARGTPCTNADAITHWRKLVARADARCGRRPLRSTRPIPRDSTR